MALHSTLGTNFNNPVSTSAQLVVLPMNLFTATLVSTLAGVFGAFFYHLTTERHTGNKTKDTDANNE